MTMSKTGIEIDETEKRIRKYVSWIVFKTGSWIDLKTIVRIELKYNVNHAKVKTVETFRPMYMNKEVKTAKTFDLILINDMDEKKVFNQFLKPGLAFKTLDALEGISNYEIVNQVEGMLKAQLKNRRR